MKINLDKINNDNDFNDYNVYEDIDSNYTKEISNQNLMRKFKKSLTEKNLNYAKKLFKNFGDKVVINDIHNLNYKTKKISIMKRKK